MPNHGTDAQDKIWSWWMTSWSESGIGSSYPQSVPPSPPKKITLAVLLLNEEILQTPT